MARLLGKAVACIYAILLLIFAIGHAFENLVSHGSECKASLVSEAPSPDGAWKAQVVEWLCESTAVTDITAGVHLVSAIRPAETTEILSVDTGGHNDERPRIVWTAPNVLRVTVPNISYLNVLRRDFDGVHIDLRYDPDDPAARAAWRRHLEERQP